MRALKFISLLMLILGSSKTILAQKINGVYFGELISEKNTLVIDASKDDLQGACYLNKTDKLNFSGTYADRLLKGSIQLNDGTEVTLEGHLDDGTLKLNLVTNGEQKTTSLVKFSSNDQYDLDDVYSDRHDPLLVGKWENVKEVDKDGARTPDGKYLIEFGSGGRKTVQIIKIPTKFQGQTPPGFDPYKKLELKWYTENQKITETVQGPRGALDSTMPYTVKGDTLMVFALKVTQYYKRK